MRGGSRAAASSKIECFVIIVNGWKSLTIITKHSILDVAAALDLPLVIYKEELHGIEIYGILNLENLSRTVFID